MEQALEELLEAVELYADEAEFPMNDDASAAFTRMIDAHRTVKTLLASEEESE
jgi:hypothetical protein